ncbi:hypothetical protein Patl1_06986 [Pistacia atlantica]|uniref:Uncharacterized protein n=1 Tax=Pistacia atlantica TaxID=434234 RepID=A0ACC1ALH8_9ROSI|nr:hypothetical protein Patl1_06986 [Pistacia atlantica]
MVTCCSLGLLVVHSVDSSQLVLGDFVNSPLPKTLTPVEDIVVEYVTDSVCVLSD